MNGPAGGDGTGRDGNGRDGNGRDGTGHGGTGRDAEAARAALELARAGRLADAERGLREALAAGPRGPLALAELANVVAARGRREEALALFDEALALDASVARTHHNRAVTLAELRRHDAAISGFDAALRLAPGFARAHAARADALRAQGWPREALAGYDRALALEPGYAPAHNGRGIALRLLARPVSALASFERALDARPGYVDAHANRAHTLIALGRLDDARDAYARAIAIDPAHAESRFGTGLVHLLRGELERGLELYEWRWRRPANPAPRHAQVAPWRGDAPLAGRHLLLHAEQGLGDTIQFCRYAPIAARAGARVTLEVQRPLAGLLRGLDGVDAVFAMGDPIPRPDLECPMGSLPFAFRTTLADVPPPAPGLRADPSLVERWSRALGPRTRRRVGLAWSGARGHANDANRSLPYASLRRLLDADADFVCVQDRVRDEDAPALAADARVRVFDGALTDFAQTAALLACVDLVVAVDTSVAHLAASLGRPTWILLPSAPDWRWMIGRDDSPWYPTARLFRQSTRGQWDDVVDRIRTALGAEPP